MYNFYALLDRMKYIKRWSLMRSVREENIMEHSWQTSVIAHALCLINNKILGGDADVQKTVGWAMYHEASEVMTGDLPTPIKYANDQLLYAYKALESKSCDKLIKLLPEELGEAMLPILKADVDSYEYRLVKAADKLSAHIKCLEEKKCSNREFCVAEKLTLETLHKYNLPEVEYFIENFLPAYEKTLDEVNIKID